MTGTQSRKFQLEEIDPTPVPLPPKWVQVEDGSMQGTMIKKSLITKLETPWYACICVLGVDLGLGSTY